MDRWAPWILNVGFALALVVGIVWYTTGPAADLGEAFLRLLGVLAIFLFLYNTNRRLQREIEANSQFELRRFRTLPRWIWVAMILLVAIGMFLGLALIGWATD